jgi:hypothetical protein
MYTPYLKVISFIHAVWERGAVDILSLFDVQPLCLLMRNILGV